MSLTPFSSGVWEEPFSFLQLQYNGLQQFQNNQEVHPPLASSCTCMDVAVQYFEEILLGVINHIECNDVHASSV